MQERVPNWVASVSDVEHKVTDSGLLGPVARKLPLST